MVEKPGIQGQPKACPETHASNGAQGCLPSSQDQQAGTVPQSLPISIEWHGDNEAKPSMGSRYHLYPHGARILVPGGYVVIMDWYSRYVLSWRLSNTLDAGFCVDALEEALRKGRPDIFNTDQGAQFTSEAFTGLLEQHGIKISMDGKGRYSDNLFIERLWRTVKYGEVYLRAYQDGKEARVAIGDYFRFYNTERPHQSLGYRTPAEVFTLSLVEVAQGGMLESLTPATLRTAGPSLNLAPVLS